MNREINSPADGLQEWLKGGLTRSFEAMWLNSDDGWNLKLEDGTWNAYWQCMDLSEGIIEMLDYWDMPFMLLSDWLTLSPKHSVTYSEDPDGTMKVTLCDDDGDDDGPVYIGIGDTTRAALVDAIHKLEDKA